MFTTGTFYVCMFALTEDGPKLPNMSILNSMRL